MEIMDQRLHSDGSSQDNTEGKVTNGKRCIQQVYKEFHSIHGNMLVKCFIGYFQLVKEKYIPYWVGKERGINEETLG